MGNRYIITGVELGLLIGLDPIEKRIQLAEEIINNKLKAAQSEESLFKFIIDNLEENEDNTDWDRGYDACLENLAHEYLTDEQLESIYGVH